MNAVAEAISRYVEREPSPASRPHLAPARRAAPEVGSIVRTAVVPHVRGVSEEERTIDFVASTETPDRYGDVIRVAGWKLDQYKKNPVFLWAHNASEPLIGRTVDIATEKNPPALIHRVQFADAATSPFADQVFRLYKGGFLKAVSVGFRPTAKPSRILDDQNEWTGGYEFNGQELLELSAVPIPANPEAVAKAVSEGIVTREFFAEAAPPTRKADRAALLQELDVMHVRLHLDLIEVALLRHVLLAEGSGTAPDEKEIETLGELFAALAGPQ